MNHDEFSAQDNADLLFQIMGETGALGRGNVTGFFRVSKNWTCPACARSKPEIARLDRNGNLLCAIPEHHDHFADFAYDRLRRVMGPSHRAVALLPSLERFPRTYICNDCNVADPAAKSVVFAPACFSFTPFEIATFVRVANNCAHVLISENVIAAYESAKKSMELLARRLRHLEANEAENLDRPE